MGCQRLTQQLLPPWEKERKGGEGGPPGEMFDGVFMNGNSFLGSIPARLIASRTDSTGREGEGEKKRKRKKGRDLLQEVCSKASGWEKRAWPPPICFGQ